MVPGLVATGPDGRFLPVQRETSDKGFQAEWRVSALATTAGTELAEGRPVKDSLGVELIDPVNPYVLTDRATKYALLFIALTFVAVGLRTASAIAKGG